MGELEEDGKTIRWELRRCCVMGSPDVCSSQDGKLAN